MFLHMEVHSKNQNPQSLKRKASPETRQSRMGIKHVFQTSYSNIENGEEKWLKKYLGK